MTYSKVNKFLIGFGLWITTTYNFAYWAHVAPEGLYKDMGSSLEVAGVGIMLAVFIGIPIVTGLWINQQGENE